MHQLGIKKLTSYIKGYKVKASDSDVMGTKGIESDFIQFPTTIYIYTCIFVEKLFGPAELVVVYLTFTLWICDK